MYDALNAAGLLGEPGADPYDILGAPQVAALLGVSPSRVVDFIEAGDLRATNIASRRKGVWAMLRRDVDAFAAAHGYPRSGPRPGRPRRA